MLWSQSTSYKLKPYSKESELEEAVNTVKEPLFGKQRIYLDDKRKIGAKGKTNNLPDGYLIDLMDAENPRLFVVENDLNAHLSLKYNRYKFWMMCFRRPTQMVRSSAREIQESL